MLIKAILFIMGIHNFKMFLNTLGYTSNKLEEYDSIFIDAQSYLYRAIQNTFKSNETQLIEDICLSVIGDLSRVLENIFTNISFQDNLKIIIAFDGESIPMKFPTQKQRRNINVEGKNLYRIVLFGHNTISDQVCLFIRNILLKDCSRLLPNDIEISTRLEFIILGSDTKGEGEHKLFFMGSHLKCRKPVIVSIDNDVFIIALSQLSKFNSIQIYKASNKILNINQFTSQCQKEYYIYASLLFGNDFIPPVVSLTESNCPIIHEALKTCTKLYTPHIFRIILQKLTDERKIRYEMPPQIEETIVLEFWKNCFWVLDYYEKYNFPQKFAENYLFDIFERNHVIVALLDKEYSEKTYKKAHSRYLNLKSSPLQEDSKSVVFTDEQLKQYERFFPKDKSSEMYHSFIIHVN